MSLPFINLLFSNGKNMAGYNTTFLFNYFVIIFKRLMRRILCDTLFEREYYMYMAFSGQIKIGLFEINLF